MSKSKLTIITASSGGVLNIKELWNFRWMFFNLIKNNTLSPYAETYLNLVWVLLRPVIIVAVMVLIKKRAGASFGVEIPYPIYLYSGVVLWWFISESITGCSNGLNAHKSLITKIYFPRLIAILIPISSNIINFLIQLIGLLILFLFYNMGVDLEIMLLPVLYLNGFVLALGLGCIFSILNFKIKDCAKGLEYILYIGFFASPIFYSVKIIPSEYLNLYFLLNPAAPIIELVRQVFNTGVPFDYYLLAQSLFGSLVILMVGLFLFRRNHEILVEQL